MSAIYGIYDKEKVNEEEFKAIGEGYTKYIFDVENIWIKGKVALGNKLQIITKQDYFECMPFYDKKNRMAITADAIIDNRDELINILEVKDKDITDSKLILLSYIKWGEECVNYLLGDYAFVIWDEINEKMMVVRDHIGKRSLYYHYSNNKFVFSTTINPIKSILNNVSLNEKWITDYFAIEGAISSIDLDETIYKEIYEIPPAHYLIVSKDGITKKKYWFPEKIKQLKLNSDEEYIERFKQIYFEAVRCRLRCDGKVGIMLSSGLDSTSVAAVAAEELSKENRTLESFTWRPIKEYISDFPKDIIPDEKELIEGFLKKYPNINSHYYRCKDKNSFNTVNELINIFEQPYKMVENAYWVNELGNNVRDNGCKILLDGQFGNFTISKGNILTYIYSLNKRLAFSRINNEINGLCKAYNGNKKIVTKNIAKKIIRSNYLIAKIIKTDKQESVVNPILSKKWNSNKRIKRIGLRIDDNRLIDDKQFKMYLTNLVLYSHMGNMETCMSLDKKMLRRDPTRDKRVIEFCLSLPESQYVKNGRERILIRRAMEGKVPDNIRLNYLSRGRQSLDWKDKIGNYYEEIIKTVTESITDEDTFKYINSNYIKELLTKKYSEINNIELRHLLIVYIWIKYKTNLQ